MLVVKRGKACKERDSTAEMSGVDLGKERNKFRGARDGEKGMKSMLWGKKESNVS